MPADAPPTDDPAVPSAPRRVRWLPGVLLLVATPLIVLGAWYAGGATSDGDRTIQMIWGIAALSLCVLAQAVWWLFFARLTWRGRLIGLAGLAAVVAGAAGLLRIDTHTGEMLPVFAFRWEPTAEERAISYFAARPPTPDESSAQADPMTESEAAVDPTTFTVTDDDWPQYRGPGRDGVETDAHIRTDWEARPPQELWRHVVGPGWSGFAVVGDRLFTQEQRGADELVVCYAADTGEQLWTYADPVRFDETLGGPGPRATPTVTADAVYTLGATGRLNRLNPLTGAKVWGRDILADAGEDGEPVANIDWGMAGSPLVNDGRVYVAPGGGRGRGVIAYDAATGELLWAAGDAPASYAAPRIETIAGVPQLLVFDGLGLKSYDPQTGKELWAFPWTNQPKVNASQPVVRGDQVFLSSGYTIGSALLNISRDGDRWNVATEWRNDNEFKLKFNDPLFYQGKLYGLDEGILACYDFETGKRHWKKGRYGYGQLILLGDVLVVLAEDGRLAAVRATPEHFEEIASFPALDGKTWNHPAYSRGRLYLRNDREAACYDVQP